MKLTVMILMAASLLFPEGNRCIDNQAFSALDAAAARSLIKTGDLFNGFYWHSAMDRADKLEYVSGLADGILMAAREYGKETESRDLFPSSLGLGDVAQNLDFFFSDVQNCQIPIPWAVSLIAITTANKRSWTDPGVIGIIADFRKRALTLRTLKPIMDKLGK